MNKINFENTNTAIKSAMESLTVILKADADLQIKLMDMFKEDLEHIANSALVDAANAIGNLKIN